MEKKNLTKKLTLNKETVSGLNNSEMNNLRGGGVTDSGGYECSTLYDCGPTGAAWTCSGSTQGCNHTNSGGYECSTLYSC